MSKPVITFVFKVLRNGAKLFGVNGSLCKSCKKASGDSGVRAVWCKALWCKSCSV